jgi:hypothetical protein
MNSGKSRENENGIVFNLKKIRDGVIGLVPDKALDKGEYAIINKMSMQSSGRSMKMDAFAFSIE